MANNNNNNNNNDSNTKCDNRLIRIQNTIKSYPDFPKKGVMFRDMFPILREPNVFNDTIEIFVEHIQSNHSKADAILGLESRGFLFAPIIALKLNLPFIPIRKAGKLAGHVKQVKYLTEYSTDTLEVQTEAIKMDANCIIVDDLIATGGSLNASIKLVNDCGAHVLECAVLIELVALDGRKHIPTPLYSIVQY